MIITIANHKGGVGKTTTAVTLATGFADLGYPTLLVDTDPQGHVTEFLGMEPYSGLYQLIVADAKLSDVIRLPTGNKCGVIGSDQRTVDVETMLRTSNFLDPTIILGEVLYPFTKNNPNGIIIIDTAPTLSSLQLAALCAADWLLIPASPEYASEAGISGLTSTLDQLQKEGYNLKLLGILPTLIDSRSKEHAQTIQDLTSIFRNFILPPIRRLIAIAEAPRSGKPIWSYAPQATDDYTLVLAAVLKRIGL